jgi:regulator of chromosome condensation
MQALVVTAGGMHTLCLATGNSLFSWGVNDEAALGRPAGGERWSKAGHSNESEASDVPGLVRMPTAAGEVVTISAGDSHSAALTNTGHVYAWGTFRGDAGVMGFSAAERFAVRSPGTSLVYFRHNRSLQTCGPALEHSQHAQRSHSLRRVPHRILCMQLLPQLVWAPRLAAHQVVKLQSGVDHVAARCANGDVLTWGSGQAGQLGRIGCRMSDRAHTGLEMVTHPAPMHLPLSLRSKPRSIACGWYSTFVILESGAVYACGLNNYSQLGFASGDTRVWAPKHAKQLRPWRVTQIASGQHHTLALADDGTVVSFGRPTYGRLGRSGVDTSSDVLVREPGKLQIADLEGQIVGIAAGDSVSGCFSKQMCGLFLCGSNTSGMLAKGDDDDDETEMTRVKRTKAFNEVQVTQLSFGGQHVAMLCIPTPAAS